jgi:hypothetical protein
MMFTMKRSDVGEFNPFHQLTYEYYNKRNRTMLSHRKVDEAHYDGVKQGRRDMYEEVFCAEVNRQRFADLTKWETVPIMVSGEARKPVQIIDALWEAHVEAIQAGTKVDWDSFYTKLDALVNNYVWSEEIKGQEADRHRDAVLAGNEEPTADDHGWLDSIRQKAQDDLDRAQQLAMEAGRKTISKS